MLKEQIKIDLHKLHLRTRPMIKVAGGVVSAFYTSYSFGVPFIFFPESYSVSFIYFMFSICFCYLGSTTILISVVCVGSKQVSFPSVFGINHLFLEEPTL